jgi:hypothetical protein
MVARRAARRIAAILDADVVDHSRLMPLGKIEGTLRLRLGSQFLELSPAD